jgi:translation initiation factor eIF-2B subunit delta
MTYLSPQISHLVAARPMSVTMGNAIRQLKLEISGSDIDLPEQDVSLPPVLYLPLFSYLSLHHAHVGQGCALPKD